MNLRFQPIKVGNIIVACAVLHNLAIEHNEEEEYIDDPFQVPVVYGEENNISGINARRSFIETYF
jgi:hypothetical protein